MNEVVFFGGPLDGSSSLLPYPMIGQTVGVIVMHANEVHAYRIEASSHDFGPAFMAVHEGGKSFSAYEEIASEVAP